MELLLPQFGLFFWSLIIFVVFFLLLRNMAWKPILKALKDREDGIAKSLASAEQARSEMAKLTAENEKLLKQAMVERAAILEDASRLKDSILAEAKEQAGKEYARRMAETQQALDAARLAAITDMKNASGQLAIAIAEKLLRKQLSDPAESQRMVQEMVKDLKLN